MDGYVDYLRTARFRSFDGLRCLSILAVVWHHSTLGPLPGVLGRGPLGVDLFFALSGFLITTLLLREGDSSHGAVASIRDFYARRALRIFPLYYAVLGLYVLHAWLLLPVSPQREHFLHNAPFFATYMSNWFVDYAVPHPVSFAFAWSLATEEQFYLVWPWVVAVRRWPGGLTGWVVPVLVLAGLLLLDQGVEQGLWTTTLLPGSLGRRIVASIASPICMGALLAQILHARRGFKAASLVLGRRWSAPILFACLALSACLDGIPLWLAQLVMTLVVGACVLRAQHALSWLTDAAPVTWVGKVSYGMYLVHVPVIVGIRRLLPPAHGGAGEAFLVALPLIVLLASASFVWFERPVQRLRSRVGSAEAVDVGAEPGGVDAALA